MYDEREAPRSILKARKKQRINAQHRHPRLRDHADAGLWQCARHGEDRCPPRHTVQSDAIAQRGGRARGMVDRITRSSPPSGPCVNGDRQLAGYRKAPRCLF
jgi:hypothetical protein